MNLNGRVEGRLPIRAGAGIVVVGLIAVGAAGLAKYPIRSPFSSSGGLAVQAAPHLRQLALQQQVQRAGRAPVQPAVASAAGAASLARASRVAPALAAVPAHVAGAVSALTRRSPSGYWLASTSLEVAVDMASTADAARLQPQVEVAPAGHPFTGHPTTTGRPVAVASGTAREVVTVVGLRSGMAYHWQARVHDMRGLNSAWSAVPGATVYVSTAEPPAPVLTLATLSRPGNWVGTRLVRIHWTQTPDQSGIHGYSYQLTRDATAEAPRHLLVSALSHGARVLAPADGTFTVVVRSRDNAGAWSPSARLTVHVDATAPTLDVLSAPRTPVNPARTTPLVRLALTDPATVSVSIVAMTAAGSGVAHGQGERTLDYPLQRAGPLDIRWDGRTARGVLAANGTTRLRITARNRGGLETTAVRTIDVRNAAAAVVADGLTQTGTFNPYDNALDGPEVITATIDAAAHVRLEVHHDSRVVQEWNLGQIEPGQLIKATWTGLDHAGVPLLGTTYSFWMYTVDGAGNKSSTKIGWVDLDHRRIVVSLSQQRVWALDGNHVLLSSLVTTGGPELPTPTGDFQIIDRQSPFTFHSPFPTSSPFWYADSPTNFALLFQVDGYFLHDAPWRSVYGPGSNSYAGTPGGNYTGTHGCVNVPYSPMAWLFNWATMYTPVQVRQDYTPPASS